MVFASNDDIHRILAVIDVRDPLGVRDLCALQLAQFTGLRISELVALNVSDVAAGHEVRRSLYVRPETAKNSRGRVVPLSSCARAVVARLLDFNKRRGFSVAPDAPLLFTKQHKRMSARTVQRLMADLRERARLATPVTMHSFRKNFATNVVAASNVRVAQQLLGHARLETLSTYAHPSQADLEQAVECLT
jgi:site-specific recombinase XerD